MLYIKNITNSLWTWCWSCLLLFSCTSPSPQSVGGKGNTDAYVHFSFDINAFGEESPSSSLRSVTQQGNSVYGTDEGTNFERTINNVWLLLYSRGNNDAESSDDVLRYKFFFDSGGSATDYSAQGGKLTSSPTTFTATSSPKLIAPGRYRAIVVANHRWAVNGAMWNIFDVPAFSAALNVGTSTYADLMNANNNVYYETWWSLGAENSNRNGAVGVLALGLKDDVVINYGTNTPTTAHLLSIPLLRRVAKLRVTFTNMINGSAPASAKEGYHISKLEVANIPWEDRIFPSAATGTSRLSTLNVLDQSETPANTFLQSLRSSQGITTDIAEQQLFAFYCAAYGSRYGALNATNKHLQQILLKIDFAKTGAATQSFTIPFLINQEGYNVVKPNYLYELRLIYKGLGRISVKWRYQVEDFTVSTMTIPAFE